MSESRIVRRLHIDRNRLRYLMKAKNITTPELAVRIGVKEKSLYTHISASMIMADNLASIAEVLGCSVEYLTGEDDQIRRPDKKITCEHCGYCKLYHDCVGSRLICTKWHIYRVNENDHCSWGEWRTMKELMGDD